jgi:hypothetical protein
MATLEHELLNAGAEVVRTALTAEKTLRGLLALGLIVLVEGELSPSTRRAVSEFHVLHAGDFNSTNEIATRLLHPSSEVQP